MVRPDARQTFLVKPSGYTCLISNNTSTKLKRKQKQSAITFICLLRIGEPAKMSSWSSVGIWSKKSHICFFLLSVPALAVIRAVSYDGNKVKCVHDRSQGRQCKECFNTMQHNGKQFNIDVCVRITWFILFRSLCLAFCSGSSMSLVKCSVLFLALLSWTGANYQWDIYPVTTFVLRQGFHSPRKVNRYMISIFSY